MIPTKYFKASLSGLVDDDGGVAMGDSMGLAFRCSNVELLGALEEQRRDWSLTEEEDGSDTRSLAHHVRKRRF